MGRVFPGVSKNGQDPELNMDSLEQDGRAEVSTRQRHGTQGDGHNHRADMNSATRISCRNTNRVDQIQAEQAGLTPGGKRRDIARSHWQYRNYKVPLRSSWQLHIFQLQPGSCRPEPTNEAGMAPIRDRP